MDSETKHTAMNRLSHELDLSELNTVEEESHVAAHQDSPVKSVHLAEDLLDLHDVEDADVALQHDESACLTTCTTHTEASARPSNKVSSDGSPSNAQACCTAAESKQCTLVQEATGSCEALQEKPVHVEAFPNCGAPWAGRDGLSMSSNDAHMLETTDSAATCTGQHALVGTGEKVCVPPGMQGFAAQPACMSVRRRANITCSHRQAACVLGGACNV
jgi:hypothetical protein